MPTHPPSHYLFSGLLFILSQLEMISAQTAVRNAVGATIEDQIFLSVGGNNGTANTGQLVGLDLRVSSWPTSRPAWVRLQPLPAQLISDSMQASYIRGDSELLLSSMGKEEAIFSQMSKTWSNVTTTAGSRSSNSGLEAVTDPTTDRVIIPSGYAGGTISGTLIYDWSNNQTSSAPGMETADSSGGIPSGIAQYAATWSKVRKSVVIFGGTGTNNAVNSKLLEFVPSTQKWSILETKGDSPEARNSACLVSAYNGQTLVLFGGSMGNSVMSSIYTLDLASLTWIKGKDIDAGLGRHSHVCSAGGDSFVALGGAIQGDVVPTNFGEPVIYDMRNGEWTKEFARDTKPPNVGAIAGGVSAALVVAIAAGLFFYRRCKAKSGASFKRSQGGISKGSDLEGRNLPPASKHFTDETIQARKNSKDPALAATAKPEAPHGPINPLDLRRNPHGTPRNLPDIPAEQDTLMYRSPQFRGDSLELQQHGFSLNPQEHAPEQYTTRGYRPPAPQRTTATHSSPTLPGVINAAPGTSIASGQEGVGSKSEDDVQRISKEIVQEQGRMERLKLRLEIEEARLNIQRLEEEKQAKLLQG